MKICNKCNKEQDGNKEQDVRNFTKRSDSKDGYRNTCKVCINKQSIVYYNKEKKDRGNCIKCNADKNKDKQRVHSDLCNPCYRKTERQKTLLLTSKKCTSCSSGSSTKWYNGPICRKCYRRKESIKIKNNDKNRYIKDRISNNLRSRVSKIVSGVVKQGSAIKDLGCTVDELKIYLESQFQPGMSWNNYGQDTWHIDHIKPLASFDLSNSDELKKAVHYTNLQPLWAKDNLKKSNKYEN
jgi:hypothetical protein